MQTKTRKTVTQVAAALGGVAALRTGNVIDIAFGAALWAAVSYGVCTLFIEYKK